MEFILGLTMSQGGKRHIFVRYAATFKKCRPGTQIPATVQEITSSWVYGGTPQIG